MKTLVLFRWLTVICTTATAMASDATNSVAESKTQKIQRLIQITGARQIARQSAFQIIGQSREIQSDCRISQVSGVERKSQPLPPALRFCLQCISAQQVGATRQRFPGAIPGTT
jgi:hypothetical protein